MKSFSAFEYLLIDIANHFGLDKLRFEERIQWAKENINNFDALQDQAETKPLFVKAMMAIRDVRQGKPTGHLVGFDGVCSGVQIMSALTGCEAGAYNTGLIHPDMRADAYSATTDTMNTILNGGVTVSRKDAKRALMTSFYGSKATPKEVFGEDTPELEAFYKAMTIVAPGAWELLQDLLASWRPWALSHDWQLPDGYQAKVKVMDKREARIEVDELAHSTFTYEYYENVGTERGLSNVANVVHSIDAYTLRCVHRRCNYDAEVLAKVRSIMAYEYHKTPVDYETKLGYYIQQWERSGIADVVILPYITAENVTQLPHALVEKLDRIMESMAVHPPFEVVTIHDEFKCHPNNMNHLRYHYKEILADLADSELIDDILSQLHGEAGKFNKLSEGLGDKIRKANYALC